MAEPTIRLERDGDVAVGRASNPPLNLFTDNAFNELMALPRRGRGLGRPGARLARRGRDLHRRRRRRTASADRRRRHPRSGERARRAADRGRAALEALEIPTLALVHGLCLTAGLEVALGCDMIWAERVVEVRPRRGGRRAHPRRRRHPADGRARRPRPGARVRDDRRPLRRGEVLERWGVINRVVADGRRAREGHAASPQQLAAGPTMAHAATKRIVRGSSTAAIERADEITPGQFAGRCSPPRTSRTRSAASSRTGPGRPVRG